MKIDELKQGDILFYRYGDHCTLYRFFTVRKVKQYKNHLMVRLMELQTTEVFFDETETWGTIEPKDNIKPKYKFKVSPSSIGHLTIRENEESVKRSIDCDKHLKFYDDKPKFFNKINYHTHRKHYIKYDSITEKNMDSRGIL